MMCINYIISVLNVELRLPPATNKFRDNMSITRWEKKSTDLFIFHGLVITHYLNVQPWK